MSLYEKAVAYKNHTRSITSVLTSLKAEGLRTHDGKALTHKYVTFLLKPLEDKVLLLLSQGLKQREIREVIISIGHTTRYGEPTSGCIGYYIYKKQVLKRKENQRRKAF